jgi:hypothetical protein
MKKALALGGLPLVAAVFITACNIGYNAELTNTKTEDLAGIEGFSYNLVITENGIETTNSTVYYSGTWLKCVTEEQTYCVELSTEQAYIIDDASQSAALGILQQGTPDPLSDFYIFNSVIDEEKVKWKKNGTETVNGIECELYGGKGSLIDQSAAVMYKIKDRNIYTRLITKNPDQSVALDINLKDLKLGGVTNDEAGIPAGYTLAQ